MMKQNPRSNLLAGDFFMPAIYPHIPGASDTTLEQINHVLLSYVQKDLDASNPLREVITYHLKAGGQRVRMRMCLAAGHALELPQETFLPLALACELVHNASLIHDDIQDKDAIRRDQPAVWAVYGADMAILAGDYLLSQAFGCLGEIASPSGALIKQLHQAIKKLIEGQTLDIQADSSEPTGSIEAYKNIVTMKSGALLALPLELTLIAAGRLEAVRLATEAGSAFSIAYQIMDDVTDLQADVRQDGHNLIHGLLSTGHKDALSLALTEALIQCQIAIDRAEQLPRQSGYFLVEQAREMATRLSILQETSNT